MYLSNKSKNHTLEFSAYFILRSSKIKNPWKIFIFQVSSQGLSDTIGFVAVRNFAPAYNMLQLT